MELGQPGALASLLAVPVIIALHSLRPRRRTVPVSTNALWREAMRERQRGLGLRKLLSDPSLLLFILFALSVCFALAEPRWLTSASLRYDAVVVVDASASMQAEDVLGGRFQRAKEAVADLIAELPDEARMLIMTSARHPVLRSAFETDKDALAVLTRELEPSDESGRPRRALSLARSLLTDRERGRVYFVTDGATDELAAAGREHLEVINVLDEAERDAPADNVAITRFDLRAEIGTVERFEVLLALRNYGPSARVVPIAVKLGERSLHTGTVTLEAGAGRTLVLPFKGSAFGRATATIEVDDALGADDRAYAVAMPEDTLLVALYSAGNFYLESALNALPNVSLTRFAPSAVAALSGQSLVHDVVIVDGVPAPPLPRGSYLLIDTLSPDLPFDEGGLVAHPRVSGRGDSALVRNVDLTGLNIDAARLVQSRGANTDVQRLFWSEETDLALAWLRDDLRVVYLGFDPARSSFPLQAAFPLFLSQSLEWLAPRGGARIGTQVAAGEAVEIPVPGGATEVIVRTPESPGERYAVTARELLFDATGRAGFYRYEVGFAARDFAVNLTDEAESDIRPRSSVPPAQPVRAAPAVSGGAQATLALWPYLAMLAVVLLLTEWAVRCFARRGDRATQPR